ncbi:MAG TPA: carboxypeptidase regulatory-like domain-containing protein [Rhodothermales bacterium]|nr:carboxypeptidase regulatory-like domain-containing protein [Rhodothermales bacterium]
MKWLGLGLLLVLGCAGSMLATTSSPTPSANTIQGTVTDARGAPLPGIFVTAHQPEQGIEVSVRTDAEGRYQLPLPHDTTYQVHAHGLGFEPAAWVSQDTHSAGALDFALQHKTNIFDQVPSAHYLALLPDGEEKQRFILDCTGCHQFNRVRGVAGPLLRSKEDWTTKSEFMLSFAGGKTNFPVISPSRDATETATWLTTHLGEPGDALPTFDLPSPAAPEESVVITEYTVPNASDLPHDLMPNANGDLIITGMMTAQMYTLDPETGAFETHAQGFGGARALTIDEAGRWWVLLGTPRQIASYDPQTQETEFFNIGMYPHSIIRDEEGKIWFNGHFTKEPELIGVLDPATGEVETFPLPNAAMPDGGTTIPYGMRIAPDGIIWATQLVGNRLIRFDPATETFTLYDLPTSTSGPRRLDIAPDGTVWIPEYAAGKLARFDPTTEQFTEYDLPIQDALPYIVRVDPRTGVVWVATGGADAVLRFFPETEHFVVHPLPTRSALIRHMELDPHREAAWVAYGNSPAVAPKIARIEVQR